MSKTTRGPLDSAEMALRRAEQKSGGPDGLTTRGTCVVVVRAYLRALARQHRGEAAADPMGVAGWLDGLATEMESSDG